MTLVLALVAGYLKDWVTELGSTVFRSSGLSGGSSSRAVKDGAGEEGSGIPSSSTVPWGLTTLDAARGGI